MRNSKKWQALSLLTLAFGLNLALFQNFSSVQDAPAILMPAAVVSACVSSPPDYLSELAVDVRTKICASLKTTVSRGAASGPAIINWAMAAYLFGDTVAMQDADLALLTFKENSKGLDAEDMSSGHAGGTDNSLVRLYGLYNSKSGLVKGRMSGATESRLLQLFLSEAQDASLLNDAPDIRSPNTQNIFISQSENIHLRVAMKNLPHARFLADADETKSVEYNGATARHHYGKWVRYFSAYFDTLAAKGLFYETSSPGYEYDSVGAVLNIYNFSGNKLLRKKAKMILDLWFAQAAEAQLNFLSGGAKSRSYPEANFDGRNSAFRQYAIFLYDSAGAGSAPPFESSPLFITSGYQPTAIARALTLGSKGVFEFDQARWGAGGDLRKTDPSTPNMLYGDLSVRRMGFASPNYMMGSYWLDASQTYSLLNGQNRWEGIIFPTSPYSRIYTQVGPSDDDCRTFNGFYSQQHQNVLITQKWHDANCTKTAGYNDTRIYLGTLSQVEEEGGWIFVREGAAYVAIKVVDAAHNPTYTKHTEQLQKSAPTVQYLTLVDGAAPVVFVANDARDYPSYKAFKSALKAKSPSSSAGVVKFGASMFYGLSSQAVTKAVAGSIKLVSPAASAFESPYIRSRWNSGIYNLRKGDECLNLDFSNPANPVEDEVCDSDSPPGVSQAAPIVF